MVKLVNESVTIELKNGTTVQALCMGVLVRLLTSCFDKRTMCPGGPFCKHQRGTLCVVSQGTITAVDMSMNTHLKQVKARAR